MKKLLLILAILLLASQAWAAHLKLEKEYQREWCERHGGILEYVLDDGARVDCLTETHAVEFDFMEKWAECIGQAGYYADKTGKIPACVLIIEDPEKAPVFIERLRRTAARFKVDWWLMETGDLK